MPSLMAAPKSPELMEGWWRACSQAAGRMPSEHAREWMEIISQVVRYYRMIKKGRRQKLQHYFRALCRHALERSRWELMLLSIYGYIPAPQLKSLYDMQSHLDLILESQ